MDTITMPATTSALVLNADDLLVETLLDSLTKLTLTKPGVVLEGLLPGPWLPKLLQQLGEDENWCLTLVGATDKATAAALPKIGPRAGEGAEHAVAMRNENTADARRLVVKLGDEARLHSLTERGYYSLGPDELVQLIAARGEERAGTQPQKLFWHQLAQGRPTVLLTGLLQVAATNWSAPNDLAADLRGLLPELGLLPDKAMFSNPTQVDKRLLLNEELLERLIQQDPDDTDKAFATLRRATNEKHPDQGILKEAFAALRHLNPAAPNFVAELRKLDMVLVDSLLNNKLQKITVLPSTPPVVQPVGGEPSEQPDDKGNDLPGGQPSGGQDWPGGGEQPGGGQDWPGGGEQPGGGGLIDGGDWPGGSYGPGGGGGPSGGGGHPPKPPLPPRVVKKHHSDTLDEVVLKLSATPDMAEKWQGEATKLWESLGNQLNDATYRLEADYTEVSGTPDAKALLLTQHFAGKQTFGGSLPQAEDLQPGQPLPTVEVTLPDSAVTQGSPWLANLKQLLATGKELVDGFEGEEKLQEWLNQRAILAEQAALLTLAPLTTLVANPALLEAARAMSRAYEELLAHVREFYGPLDQAGGAAEISTALLAPDVVALPGPSQQAALLSPLHPLTLWKYATVADELLAGRGQELLPLLGRLDEIAEPLRALVLPEMNGNTSAQLAYVRRIGAWVQYQQAGPVEVTTSGTIISQAARKLAILYPMVRRQLRLLLHHPDSLDKLKPALNDLLKSDFTQIQLILTYRPGQEGILPLSSLDELITNKLLIPERVEIANTEKLAEWLSKRPVHLLVLPGQRRLEPLLVSKQATELHPLSLPHTLHFNQFKGEVSLLPRSQQRDPKAPEHPFGAYHGLTSVVGRLTNQEVSGTSQPRTNSPDLPVVLPYAVFVVAGSPAEPPEKGALPLARPTGSQGDLVLTHYADRFTKGVEQMLTKSNYQPRTEDIFKLLRELEEVGHTSLFATISASTPGGFNASSLKGQLGQAVALRWYAEKAEDARCAVISLDSALARRSWLAHRETSQRNDLLGVRWLKGGGISFDLIEVKSYDVGSTVDGDGTPGEQLRAVARDLLPVVSGQSGPGGKLVTDCRREALRLQLFQEGQLRMPVGFDKSTWNKWIVQLNQALDGQLAVEVNLLLIEVLFDQNEEVKEIVYLGDATALAPEKKLNLRREQLGEPDIRRLLGELPPTLGTSPISSADTPTPTPTTDLTSSSGTPVVPSAAVEAPADEQPTKQEVVSVLKPAEEVVAAVEIPSIKIAVAEPTELEQPALASADTVLVVPPPAGMVEQLATSLYRALQNHDQTPVKAIDPTIADIGPSLIRLKVVLKGGQKVSDIQRLASDLQREMRLEHPPIIGNLPGTGFVAVEVGRTDRQPVLLGSVLDVRNDEPPVSFPAGVGANGKVQWLNIPRLPHMLIGGTTGAGKTYFLYTMIKALTQLNGPETLELVLVDPKQTDFGYFSKLPHLRQGRILYEPEEAVEMLNDLLKTELPRRTALLRKQECRDIHEYRQLIDVEPMPFTIVIIDEFADLIQSLGTKDRKQFEENVGRLAQRTRSVGIHLVVATQRPDMKVIPGNLKNNLDCRVAFRLASGTDSRVILDEVGAEDLLGKGDMLLKQQGQIQRLQGFFIATADLKK
jgi:hypothetical protein